MHTHVHVYTRVYISGHTQQCHTFTYMLTHVYYISEHTTHIHKVHG